MIIELVFIFFLVICSAFFSAAEIAIFSLSAGQVRDMVNHGLSGAETIEKLKRRPKRLLAAILTGNNLVNITAASLATKIAINAFGSVGVGFATGVMTVLILVFGEVFPKTWAQTHAKRMARISAPIMLIIEYVFYPIVIAFEGSTKKLIKKPVENRQLLIEREIKALLHIGVEEGNLEHHEHEFVERLFRFNDITIEEIMRPIDDVDMIAANAVIEQAAHFAAHSDHYRFPVYDGGRSNIVGFVRSKDLSRANNSKRRKNTIATIMRPPIAVSPEEPVDEVFKKFRAQKIRQAIVKDSDGDVLGVVTTEDILEELVGEVFDEPASTYNVKSPSAPAD